MQGACWLREAAMAVLLSQLTLVPPLPHPRAQTDTHTVKMVRAGLRWLISGNSRTQDFRDKT